MNEAATEHQRGLWRSIKPYLERESLAAFFLGVSSGFPYALIGATLTTRLAQDGITKKTVTAFTLAFLVYNLKVFWAWMVDGVRLPLLGRLGQRVALGQVLDLAQGLRSAVAARRPYRVPPRPAVLAMRPDDEAPRATR